MVKNSYLPVLCFDNLLYFLSWKLNSEFILFLHSCMRVKGFMVNRNSTNFVKLIRHWHLKSRAELQVIFHKNMTIHVLLFQLKVLISYIYWQIKKYIFYNQFWTYSSFWFSCIYLQFSFHCILNNSHVILLYFFVFTCN